MFPWFSLSLLKRRTHPLIPFSRLVSVVSSWRLVLFIPPSAYLPRPLVLFLVPLFFSFLVPPLFSFLISFSLLVPSVSFLVSSFSFLLLLVFSSSVSSRPRLVFASCSSVLLRGMAIERSDKAWARHGKAWHGICIVSGEQGETVPHATPPTRQSDKDGTQDRNEVGRYGTRRDA